MNSIKTFTVSIYSENNVGLLNRISGIFQRRHVNVESINISISEIKNVSKWAIVVKITEVQMKKIIGQIEKQVEVIKAYYHTNDEIVYRVSSMFKLKSSLLLADDEVQDKIKAVRAEIVTINKDYFVIEKSGSIEQIEDLYNFLSPYGIMQFVRSGRIIISKELMGISKILQALNH